MPVVKYVLPDLTRFMKQNNNCLYNYDKTPQNYLTTSGKNNYSCHYPPLLNHMPILMIPYRDNGAF